MLPIVSFCLGLLLGLAIYYWKQYRFNLGLQKIFQSLQMPKDGKISLSVVSQIRREIFRLQDLLQQQQKELELWEDLMAKAPLGYLRVDKDNQLLFCNRAAQRILQISDWQVEQLRLLLELVRSYELDQLIQTTRNSQQPQTQTWQFYAQDWQNQLQAIALKGHGFPLQKGEIAVFIENVQSLVEINRIRERAFSDLTHELRTPLTSIALVAETLSDRLQGREKSWVTKMYKETQRLIELVENWLELSKITHNPNAYLDYQLIDLESLILVSWRTIEPMATEKQVSLNCEITPAIKIEGDQLRLTQVFLNLFDNAVKHSPSPGVIRVNTELTQENTIVINIVDAGDGFAVQDLPYIFDRLYRGDSSRTRQSPDTGGSGLGLTIAQQIIKVHAGEIKAQNDPVTGGAWLQIILPLPVPT